MGIFDRRKLSVLLVLAGVVRSLVEKHFTRGSVCRYGRNLGGRVLAFSCVAGGVVVGVWLA